MCIPTERCTEALRDTGGTAGDFTSWSWQQERNLGPRTFRNDDISHVVQANKNNARAKRRQVAVSTRLHAMVLARKTDGDFDGRRSHERSSSHRCSGDERSD